MYAGARFLIMISGPGLISPGPTKVPPGHRKKTQKNYVFCLHIVF